MTYDKSRKGKFSFGKFMKSSTSKNGGFDDGGDLLSHFKQMDSDGSGFVDQLELS